MCVLHSSLHGVFVAASVVSSLPVVILSANLCPKGCKLASVYLMLELC